jgi:hypothetical protein
MKGFSLVIFFGYSNNYFIISQILSNMLEIIMYLIIDFNVSGVTVGDNFLFAIGV